MNSLLFFRPLAAACMAAAVCAPLHAQQKPGGAALPSVTITAPSRGDPVEKSYRKMIRGMDLFERLHAMAPGASLRFKLLPRQRGTDMDSIRLEVIGDTVDIPVAVAPDRTFTLPRDRKAWDENAVVSPNRRKQSMTWRTDIRTPGLPQDTRRLGDLRLECEVGIEAELVSNNHSVFGALANLIGDAGGYCKRKDARYLFFADRPLFGVTLAAGSRRESLPADKLYAMAVDDPDLKADLPYCDCEVLVDRTYYLPLGDTTWPDDTRVEFEYMDEASASANPPHAALALVVPGQSTKAEVEAVLGKPAPVRFDSGWDVWVYRWRGQQSTTHGDTELVILFGSDGVVKKARLRPPFPPSAS